MIAPAPNGFLLEQGKNLVGYGKVIGDFINQGYVKGEGFAPADLLELTGHVKGIGNFGGNIMLSGTYSPGNSPAHVDLENALFGSANTLLMEIGGLTPGTQYDQLDVSGLATLGGTLQVDFLNGFTLSLGKEFDLILGSTTGQFSQVLGLPSGWHVEYSSDRVTVVPEPRRRWRCWLWAAWAAWRPPGPPESFRWRVRLQGCGTAAG